MSDDTNTRLLKNEKNLIIRAINITMFAKIRYSIKEKKKKLKEYEEDFLSGNRENIINDLLSFKEKYFLIKEQEEELLNIVNKIRELNVKKGKKEDKKDGTFVFNNLQNFYEWLDKNIGEKKLLEDIYNMQTFFLMLYEKTKDRILISEDDNSFFIGIISDDKNVTWVEDFSSLMVELKRRLFIEDDKDFNKCYEVLRKTEKELLTKKITESQMRW